MGRLDSRSNCYYWIAVQTSDKNLLRKFNGEVLLEQFDFQGAPGKGKEVPPAMGILFQRRSVKGN